MGESLKAKAELYIEEEYDKLSQEVKENGVMHRLLTERARVQVAIFDDRVEITSPGALYNGLTVKQIFEEGKTATRNACIANVFQYLFVIENWGTGLTRAFAACEEAGIEAPEFREIGSTVRVVFKRPSYNNILVSDQDSDQDSDQVEDGDVLKLIVEYCKEARTLKEIMNHFNFKHRTNFVNNYIKPLLDKGKLKHTIPDKPKSKNQKYIKNR